MDSDLVFTFEIKKRVIAQLYNIIAYSFINHAQLWPLHKIVCFIQLC